MLCVAVVVHKETLGISNEIDEQPTLPVLLQWVNKRGTPFSNQDLAISRRLRATMQRLADAKQKERQITLLQERFVLGDARRVALMESAKMLAKKMEMSHLFSAVMAHAKELMEVGRLSSADARSQLLCGVPPLPSFMQRHAQSYAPN